MVVIGGCDSSTSQKMNSQEKGKKTQKRKRASLGLEMLGREEKEAKIEALRIELDGLFGYFTEVMNQKVGLEVKPSGNNINAVVAALMEESGLPLSKLVQQIFDELKGVEDFRNLTAPTVKSTVLLVGQRILYGVPDADADVLEDDSNACMWCWETRDLKLMPKSMRGLLTSRRTCRRKIHERITAVADMMMALQKSDSDQNYKHDLIKATEKLGKVRREEDIRSFVNDLLQRNGSHLADKDSKREEKMQIKQLEKDKKEAEKEKRRQKQMQEEAEKEEKRREKEESELRKQMIKQQEEAEKDQRRREKEEAELKKKLSIQKQASIMERFLKRPKINPSKIEPSSPEAITFDSTSKKSESQHEAATCSMDCTLLSNKDITVEDIRRSHLSSWNQLSHSIHSNRNQHWGMRRKPKIKMFKELKLTTNRGHVQDGESNVEKLVDGLEEQTSKDESCQSNSNNSVPIVKKLRKGKQLLQFDKSYRPAFYGIWPKKSCIVGPRHPLRKDPDLDYDIDSDEEWEEVEPGESLSDCDKDEDEESLEESKIDNEDDCEDGFFVPDGYLSENEGAQADRLETGSSFEEARSSPGSKQDFETKELSALVREQNHLHYLTEHALRKNQPLIVLNFMHEKSSLIFDGDLGGTNRTEQICLQALRMCSFPCGPLVEITLDDGNVDDQEACTSSGTSKTSKTPPSNAIAMSDSELRTVVSAIHSGPYGIHKMVESLQQKFPAFSKSRIRNKIREISDFVDNRWQVKKEVLVKLGLSITPDKSSGQTQNNIVALFSKRCLLPTVEGINPKENLSQPPHKLDSVMERKT